MMTACDSVINAILHAANKYYFDSHQKVHEV